MTAASFSEVGERIEGVEGWLTEAQAEVLYGAARRCPAGGRIVEIGSFRGRSTIVLASAAPDEVEVIAIDPHAGNDRGPREIAGYAEAAATDAQAFAANLARAGVSGRVRHLPLFSADALGEVDGPIDVLYIDGAHRFGPANDDLRAWGGRVTDGGTMLVHDAFSSVGVTAALFAQARRAPRRYRYLGRAGSLAVFAVGPLDRRSWAASFLRQCAQLPWFGRNVVIKALIAAHLGRLTGLLGHHDATWPY